jgi:hypothetical protein
LISKENGIGTDEEDPEPDIVEDTLDSVSHYSL